MGLDVSGSLGTLSDGAAACGWNPNNTAINSSEQLFSPIVIRKDANVSGELVSGFQKAIGDGKSSGQFAAGHIGPTRDELDPYFSNALGSPSNWMNGCDFQIALNNGPGPNGPDANIRKVNRQLISEVRVNHHRGPLIVSGWGFGVDDRPVPSAPGDPFSFHQETLNNRGMWKAGPVDLKWDEVRKVWSGGPHIVCGVASQAVTSPSDPCSPTYFKMKVFRNSDSNPTAADLTNCDQTETITVTNRDPSLYQQNVAGKVFVIAARINYEWIPLWVGCPDPPEDPDEEPPSCVC